MRTNSNDSESHSEPDSESNPRPNEDSQDQSEAFSQSQIWEHTLYDELRKLAANRLRHEQPGQSLEATALVHEAYMRLVGGTQRNWDSKGHFFAAAAESMRRILINRARDKNRLKRGGGRRRFDLSNVTVALDTPDEVLVELDEALQLLAEEDAEAAELVKLKFFAGLSMTDAAASMGMTRRQGDRVWSYARAWLFDKLREE